MTDAASPRTREQRLDALDDALMDDAEMYELIGKDHLAIAKRLLTQNNGSPKKDLGVVSAWASEHRDDIRREETAAENAFKQALKIREAIIGAKKRGPTSKMRASDAPAPTRDPATAALLAKKKQREDEAAARKAERMKASDEAIGATGYAVAPSLGEIADLEPEEGQS